MLIVALQATPNQTVRVTLAGQAVQLNVYQKAFGLFIDVLVDDEVIVAGALCLDRTRVVRDAYLGFAGDLGFIDNQGASDPNYTGLGGRFSLAYLEPGVDV